MREFRKLTKGPTRTGRLFRWLEQSGSATYRRYERRSSPGRPPQLCGIKVNALFTSSDNDSWPPDEKIGSILSRCPRENQSQTKSKCIEYRRNARKTRRDDRSVVADAYDQVEHAQLWARVAKHFPRSNNWEDPRTRTYGIFHNIFKKVWSTSERSR
jgi:hypothetical protein